MPPKRSRRQARLSFGRDRPDEPSSPSDRVATPYLATPAPPTLESSLSESATLIVHVKGAIEYGLITILRISTKSVKGSK